MSPTAAKGTIAKRPRANPLYALARFIFGVAVDTYFRRIEVRDRERLPRAGPVLIVANHPAGMTDAVILSTQLDRPVHFIAMAPLFEPWLRGVAMRAMGALPVYRQQALACAASLADGPRRIAEIRSSIPDAPRILQRDVYGWFSRVERGVYALTPAGTTALRRWPQAPSPLSALGAERPVDDRPKAPVAAKR